MRFHVDVSKFAKLVIDNDDIMDLVDMYSDADDFEEAMNALTGDVAVTVEINGTNIFILAGGAINSKTTVLSSFASAFGAVNNPTKVPMNEDVVSDMVDAAVDYVTSAMYGSYSYDDYDYDYDYDYDDDDYDYDEDED